jgi:hypothetical protein
MSPAINNKLDGLLSCLLDHDLILHRILELSN